MILSQEHHPLARLSAGRIELPIVDAAGDGPSVIASAVPPHFSLPGVESTIEQLTNSPPADVIDAELHLLRSRNLDVCTAVEILKGFGLLGAKSRHDPAGAISDPALLTSEY
jgi:hypothetical protein